MELFIHRYIEATEVEGPGKRFCLWVQGCSIRCDGCAVPWTWKKEKGRRVSVEALFAEILKSKREHQIEGVTFLGGEPFDQAEALGKLAGMVKEAGLSVMVFTGYVLEDLMKREECRPLLDAADLLIDGPFKKDELDMGRPWVGSRNQRYHFLTPVYRHLERELMGIDNKVEIRITENGAISINGMAPSATLEKLFGSEEFRRFLSKE